MRRWLVVLAGSIGLLGALPAAAVELFDAPNHLRFSAREVSAAARRHQPATESPLAACDDRCDRVQRIWNRLLPFALEQPRSDTVEPRLVLVDAGPSAYVHADGTVVFPLALADALALTDAEIAFVLAHELIHVLLEHEREILTGADALLRPDVRRSAADIYGALNYDLGLALKTAFLMQAAEHEADAFGLQLAALAGFDPAEQASALAKLAVRDARRAVLPTHPADSERQARLQAVLPAAQALYRER